MFEIKLYKSPWKAIKLILLASPFVILALYDIIKHENIVPIALDWFCLCFFGLGIPLGIFNLLDNRPQIVINATGIFDRTAYKDFINWSIINDAYLNDVKTSRYNRQKFVCLVLDKDAVTHLKGNKTMMNFSKSLGFQEVNLNINPLKNVDGLKLTDFIKAMLHADPHTRQNLLLNSTL